MDSYLQIAQAVLRSARRPMGAKAILDLAYQADVVPKHLYGKTQQKTLQARLSEEILHHRGTSPFYRTEPGQFFLTEFLDADDIPEEWKKPFPARRRTRDLTRDNTAEGRAHPRPAVYPFRFSAQQTCPSRSIGKRRARGASAPAGAVSSLRCGPHHPPPPPD